jgi:hypothetical protein
VSELVASDDPRILNLINIFKPVNQGGSITITDFLAGGDNILLNREIYLFVSKIKSGNFKVQDDQNFRDFNAWASRVYRAGEYSNFWIGTKVTTYSRGQVFDVGADRLFQDHPLFALDLFSNKIKGFILKDGQIETQVTSLSSEQKTDLSEEIFKSISNDELGNLIKNDVIRYIVENNFDFGDFQATISSFVNDILSDKEGAGFEFQIPKWAYSEYLNLQVTNEVNYGLTKKLYPGGKPKIVKSPTLSQAQVILDGVRDLPQVEGFSQKTDQVLWPDVAITNLNGDLIPGATELLVTFDQLQGSDVSNYPFQYFTRTRKEFSFLSNPLKALTQAFSGPDDTLFYTKNVIDQLLKHAYAKIILQILEDLSDDNTIDQTVGRTFNNYYSSDDGEKLVSTISTYILIDKEVVRRKVFWDAISEAEEDGEGVSSEEEAAALSEALNAWAVGAPPPIEKELTEEDIANRRKFFKQCALLMNLPVLRNTYDSELKKRYDGEKLYKDRFYMAYCAEGGQEKLLSNLLTDRDQQKLLEIPSHVLSSLVPKIRLFKVKEKGDKVLNTEFVFDATSQIDRAGSTFVKATTFMTEEFDKGSGCGLTEFSFEFNGTNPAEARNDIKATLKLHFQSFSDFIRERKSKDGSIYKYVDLIIQPNPDPDTQTINNIEVISNRQYEPSFYRIRADVGYYTDGIADEKLKEAIMVSNKSLFLNMVDHDIQFRNDGSVDISISYRAYVESLLKHPRLDALASPELIKKRIENAKILTNELSKRQCSKERIQELQVSIAATEEVILKRSLSSIIDRMRRRGVIYQVQVTDEDRKQFLQDGFFKRCRLKSSVIIPQKDAAGKYRGRNNADVGVVLNNKLPEKSDDFDFIDDNNGLVQFFFFGDLLYTILDCVYEDNSSTPRKASGFRNSKILLGSFEFDPFQIFESQDKVFNIAQMPISVDFFSRWFVDEVMAQKSTRKTFPVLNFIRSLTNQLIKPSLLETCVNRSVDKTLRFQTCQVTAYNEGNKDPLKEKNTPSQSDRVGMEVMEMRKEEILPLKGGGDNDEDPNNFFNYIVLSTAGSTLSYSGNGTYEKDIEEGRLHVNIGQNSGLVKSISLSKSDQQYIREARYYQQGIDGLLQLSAVYVANLEMFGNTLFYPGMEFFFNPYGLGGGTEFGSPTHPASVANKLGIGGYHTKTTVAGQQYYSGDGSGNPNLRGKRKQNKENALIDSYVPENEDDDACETVILGVQRFDPDNIEDASKDSNSVEASSDSAGPELRDEGESEQPPTEEESIDPFGESELTEEDEARFGTSEQE